MKHISKLFFSGLVAVVPLTLTIYVLFWLTTTVEEIVGGVLKQFVPPEHYVTGMGMLAGLLILVSIGLLLKAWLFQRLFHWGENMLARLPLIKTLYTSLRDLMQFVSRPKEQEMGKVVTVKLDNGTSMIGFLTQENPQQLNKGLPANTVAVYIPLSYQIGGHLVFVPKELVTPLNMSMNDALRFTITAGMIKSEKSD